MSVEQLYKHFYPKLAGYASLYLNMDAAHDIVQDVFIDMLEKQYDKMHLDSDTAEISALLYRAVHNKCVDAIRRKTVRDKYATASVREFRETEAKALFESYNEVEEQLFSTELAQSIAAGIETLSPKRKTVFKLYFNENKKAKEIAELLGITVSTVQNQINACFKLLREKLKDLV